MSPNFTGLKQGIASNLSSIVKQAGNGSLDPDKELIIGESARLGLTYWQEALVKRLPGYAFVQVLSPNHVWLPNAAPADPRFPVMLGGQAVCLGAKLPASIPVKELILMTYGALTLQSVQMDAFDAAGIMNGPSAEWWMQNKERIPLTRESFLPDTSKNS